MYLWIIDGEEGRCVRHPQLRPTSSPKYGFITQEAGLVTGPPSRCGRGYVEASRAHLVPRPNLTSVKAGAEPGQSLALTSHRPPRGPASSNALAAAAGEGFRLDEVTCRSLLPLPAKSAQNGIEGPGPPLSSLMKEGGAKTFTRSVNSPFVVPSEPPVATTPGCPQGIAVDAGAGHPGAASSLLKRMLARPSRWSTRGIPDSRAFSLEVVESRCARPARPRARGHVHHFAAGALAFSTFEQQARQQEIRQGDRSRKRLLDAGPGDRPALHENGAGVC